MSKARLLSSGALVTIMALALTTGACKKRLKLVDVDDDKKPAPAAAPPPIAQTDPPPVTPPPDDPPPAPPEEEPPPILPATAKVPVPAPKPVTTTTAKPNPAATTTAKPGATTTTAAKGFPPTCAGTCEKALRCMNAYSEVEHASCVVECSQHPVNREKLADLNSKDCATLVAMLKKK